ncbi:hypothetical protein TNCT_563981, partial [Trichonephila clavata]
MLKSPQELAIISPDSTDVLKKGVIEYYLLRPDELEDLYLADFVANRTKVSAKRTHDTEQPDEDRDAQEDARAFVASKQTQDPLRNLQSQNNQPRSFDNYGPTVDSDCAE